MKTMSMPPRSPDGSIKAREVEVAGEFEDQLMKMLLNKVTKEVFMIS